MVEKRIMTFDGIVMYQRPHKERDLLVKILTRQGGKRMFFIKNGKSKRNQLAAELQPLTIATYEGTLNQNGLSFIDDVKTAHVSRIMMEDVVLNAYATYILGLIDSAFVDNQPVEQWFDWAKLAIEKMESGFDPQGLANYFEIKLLPAFGLNPTFGACAICGRRDLPLDFSERFNGTICQLHWSRDDQRMQANPKAVRILAKLSELNLEQLSSLSLKEETKADMTRIMDKIYDEQVGLHLRSKSFIQQLSSWQSKLQKNTDN
ncbi:MAG: DNA repair protein RecO [Lactobacillaceae bacterium]|jgi:DNA repair protein RecO (recombination protein O)|nr:DNA repair protein RecO [Lactobacillaceae bacterium]